MFKIVASPTFPAVCKITRLGEIDAGDLPVVFRHMGERAHDAWLASAKDSNDIDFLDKVIVSWEACGEDGQPMPYSKDALGLLLDGFPAAGREIFNCYEKARLESRTGN